MPTNSGRFRMARDIPSAELLREALALPVADRAEVAAELVASLDETPAENAAELEDAALWYEGQRRDWPEARPSS